MHFETPYGNGNKNGNLMRGFFVPPKTTRYRFYMACDDACRLNIALDASQPEVMTEILVNHAATGYRRYFKSHAHGTLISDWISMTEGVAHAIEGRHIDHTWGDHFTVSVEVEQSDIVGHPHAMKEI